MNLRDWLHFNRITRVKMAKDLDVAPAHIVKIVLGTVEPGTSLAYRIIEYTKGEVTMEELRPKALLKKKIHEEVKQRMQNSIGKNFEKA